MFAEVNFAIQGEGKICKFRGWEILKSFAEFKFVVDIQIPRNFLPFLRYIKRINNEKYSKHMLYHWHYVCKLQVDTLCRFINKLWLRKQLRDVRYFAVPKIDELYLRTKESNVHNKLEFRSYHKTMLLIRDLLLTTT